MTSSALPATIYDVPTPCLLVDLEKVKANCQRMIDTSSRMGVHLRPHMKTHKTIEIGKIATNGSCKGIVVSTLSEAEFYADNGFDDIMLAVPIAKFKIPRCQKLVNRLTRFHVMFDSMEALTWLQEAPLDSGKKWSVILKVDTGYGRSGVLWDSEDVVRLGKAADEDESIIFLGVYTHCGKSYDCKGETELKTFGNENTNRLLSIQTRLKEAGVECMVVATGSTPSCSMPSDNMASLTEFHPGNYVFYDLEHYLIGACALDDIAVRVATRVVSQKPSLQQLVVDCGFTGISHDGQKQKGADFCVIQNNPKLRLVDMSQELGKVRPVEGNMDFDKYPLGTMLFFYPYHACATAAMHPVYYIHSGDKIVDMWKPTRGW